MAIIALSAGILIAMPFNADAENVYDNTYYALRGRKFFVPDIANLTEGKDKIIILNKSDLADKKQNELWVQYFKEKGQPAILANCNEGKGINEILRATEKIKQAEMEEYAEKGRTGRKIRAMVLGIPNVRKIIIYK